MYDRLTDIGKDYGLQHVGYMAMKTLRIEKFFGFWGQDFNPTTTPLECGRAFRVKFEVCFHGTKILELYPKHPVSK